uniref:Uncharacterized protein n=1 Tax=Ciona savignyi TaxID=51511 RepID=H2Z2E5_CIOSA
MSLLESSQKLQRTQPWPELNSGVSEDRGLRKSNEEVTIMENNLNIQPDSVSSVVEIKGQPNLLTLYNVPETNLSTTDEHFKITNKIEQHENEDISSGLIWTNGVATLSGSDLKFRMSATGDLEVISDTEETAVDQSPTATCWNENEEPVIPLITSGTVKNENQTGVGDHLNTENLAIISTIKSETTPDTPNASEIRTCSQCGYS